MFAKIIQQLLDLANEEQYLSDDDLSPLERTALSEYVHPVTGQQGCVLWPIGELAGWR